MENDSSVSMGDVATATDRLAGGTVTALNADEQAADSNLLLHKPFTKPADQVIVGEVSPREQQGPSPPGGAEMVVDHTPSPPSVVVESSGRGSHQITEENDNTGSQLVPGAGFNGNDRLQMVSKDWVLSQIEARVGEAQQSNSQEISDLKEKMEQMELKFEEQMKEKDEELKCKQKKLDKCQEELKSYKQQVEQLQSKLTEEAEARADAELEKNDLEEKVIHKEEEIRELKMEIKGLSEKTKMMEERAKLSEERAKLYEDVIQQLVSSTSNSGTQLTASPREPSPEPGTFKSLQGLHPYDQTHSSDKMVISPTPSLGDYDNHEMQY